MRAPRWILPALLLASLESGAYSEITGPIRTDRFNADQLALLYKARIFPVDESATTLPLGQEMEPDSITLICLAGAEVDHAENLLEGRLPLKRDPQAHLEYRDQFGGIWLARVDPSNGTIALRPKQARGYRFAVNGQGTGLDLLEIVEFKVLQRILAARQPKERAAGFSAARDELSGNVANTARELNNPVKP